MTHTPHTAEALACEVDEVALTYPDMAEVSAMLRSQAQEIERLTASIEVWRDEDRRKMITITNLRELCEAYVSAISGLRAETDKLRTALEKIASNKGNGDHDEVIARAALKEVK